jgi:hypothetical protein
MAEWKRLLIGTGLLMSLLSIALLCGLSCGGTDPDPPKPEVLSDFHYADINTGSPTGGTTISPGGVGDKVLILFCGELECSTCIAQLVGLQQVIETVNAKSDLVDGWMINYATDDGSNDGILGIRQITLPVVQDTMVVHEQINTPSISVSDEIYFRDLVVVRPDLTIARRSDCGYDSEPENYELDLDDEAGRTALIGWINEVLADN